MVDPLSCDDCGIEFEEGDSVLVVQDGRFDGHGLQTYGSEYYHEQCDGVGGRSDG